MIAGYAFIAIFLVQISVISVLYPLRFSWLVKTALERIPAQRLADFYPGVDVGRAHARFLARYRVANAFVAVLGVLLMGWIFIDMRRTDWVAGRVGAVLTAYFFLQNVPVILMAWFTTRFNKVHRRPSPEGRRTAVLQRRGLFDFISPLTVALAVLSYSLFAAFMFYVARHPFPGFGGPFANIGIVSLGYLLFGFVVYRFVYGRKTDPLQTHSDRMHMIRVVVTVMAWTCILVPIIVSLTVARQLLGLETWGPFIGSLEFLAIGLLGLRALSLSAEPGGS
ncbi:MAG: hypothetical protein ABW278_15440 [Steroidobacteraceae bacterium]